MTGITSTLIDMTEQEWRNRFAFILRKKMRNKNMTQRDLAEAVGITECAISKYIQAKRTPRPNIISKLALVLECTTDELIRFDNIHILKRF